MSNSEQLPIRVILRPNGTEEQPTTSSSSKPAPTPNLMGRPNQNNLFVHGMPLMIGEKILYPAGIVKVQSMQEIPTTSNNWMNQTPRVSGTFTTPIRMSPVQARMGYEQPRKTKVVQAVPFMTIPTLNQAPQPQQNWNVSSSLVTSSATPDSGIQSVPTSPPSPNPNTSIDNDIQDYADMPRLLPADQEEEEECPDEEPSSTCPKEDGTSNASECETTTTSTPLISISPSMDSAEIVNRLIALDPEKANAIAMLIKKKTQGPRKRKVPPSCDNEGEVSSTTPNPPLKQKKKKAEEEASAVEERCTEVESAVDEEEVRLRYRMAIRRKIDEAMKKEIENCVEEMKQLYISTLAEKREERRKRPKREPKKVRQRRSRTTESPPNILNTEGKFNGEYEEIPRSVASSEKLLDLWKSPILYCGCTKGACTSDVECLNRALRVQCAHDCSVTLCANKKFWKEDTSRLCVSNGPKTKRYLKTRTSRRAGELLCEYAGEVIESSEARRRAMNATDSRILAISANLFVDATKKGNIGRFVRHSCKPNSRLEVWSINGYYRAGIFALFDIGSGCEITIDKNGLVPKLLTCNCGQNNCKRFIRPAKNCLIVSSAPSTLPKNPGVFLPRNIRKSLHRRCGLPPVISDPMKRAFEAVAYRVKNIDGSIPHKYLSGYTSIKKFLASGEQDIESFLVLMRKWLDVVDDDDIERAFIVIQEKWLKKVKSSSKSFSPVPAPQQSSTATAKKFDADLSYLESNYPIGSYDPDEAWLNYKANANDNAVRCICGSLDEEGEMVQCDKCHFWLHIDCIAAYNPEEDYLCQFCLGKIKCTPSMDVKLRTQPELRFEDCVYYKALMNRRGMQVRLNETVYVNKQVPEDHKILLRNLKEQNGNKRRKKEKKTFSFPEASTSKIEGTRVDRKDARIFRVERLFTTPGGHRFVFGFFYAWPHETYIDPQRKFHIREVFPTVLYDTLPLDEVVGRCMVIDVETWCAGRPNVPLFKEEDVFFYEYQLAKNQRGFERVPSKNRYPINTQPYVFGMFPRKVKIVRDFQPYARKSLKSSNKNNETDLEQSKCKSNSINILENVIRNIKKRKKAKKRIN